MAILKKLLIEQLKFLKTINMFLNLKKKINIIKDYRKFVAIDHLSRKSLVIYSEGSHDWPHISPIIKKIIDISDTNISYLSSHVDDPGLSFEHKKFHKFFIGDGAIRTLIFHTIKCKVFLMTMPDLESFHLKRSNYKHIKYVYTFHSINSTHVAYRNKAFKSYDVIYCVGPHHKNELKKENKIYSLNNRKLIDIGSIKLDSLINEFDKIKGPTKNIEKKILLAPSWGKSSFAENSDLINSIVLAVLKNGYKCTLRYHPMTIRRKPDIDKKLLIDIEKKINTKNFFIEKNHNDNSSLCEADLLISDWSGASTEFAFALERPVLFIDTIQKINNHKWQEYNLPCLEKEIRNQIGIVVEPENIIKISDFIKSIMNNHKKIRKNIVDARDKNIYNIGNSSVLAAKHLSNLIDKQYSL